MKRAIIFLTFLLFLFVAVNPSLAHSGCCSHHGGVSGCQCADGTPLSNTCLPYYPECSGSSGSNQTVSTAPVQPQNSNTNSITSVPPVNATTPLIVVTNTPVPTIIPTITISPTPIPTKKVIKNITKRIVIATPTHKEQGNFFTWLFGFIFGQQTQKQVSQVQQASTKYAHAGDETSNSQCKAKNVDPNNPQAYLPDPNCTPGSFNTAVTQATIQSTICVQGYTKTIRPPASYTNELKRQQMQEYGYTDTNPSDFEEDHFIPLEIGGNPTDPKNLWPEPHPSTNDKDKVEDYLHRQVCSGQLTLQKAQQEIQSNWYVVYQQTY